MKRIKDILWFLLFVAFVVYGGRTLLHLADQNGQMIVLSGGVVMSVGLAIGISVQVWRQVRH